jgi:BirA family biotin operon repressor/biotin-[acetyl-CoA-carboxylase] ligase
MKVITDKPEYANQLLGKQMRWTESSCSLYEGGLQQLFHRLFPKKRLYRSNEPSDHVWNYILAVESAPESQYDILVELSQKHITLPDALLCVAGAGKRFHGFKNRPWESLAGNIHLSVFVAPNKAMFHLGAAFMVLPAVSVVQTIDTIACLENRASIKWVNDIVIEGAKVCGVLAHTQAVEKTITEAVLGIGLNVETTPRVVPSPFTPKVASLSEFVENNSACNKRSVFSALRRLLSVNYLALLNGGYPALLDMYRKRSCVIGKKVTICQDDRCSETVTGRVANIGENLELYLKERDKPIVRGRLIMSA